MGCRPVAGDLTAKHQFVTTADSNASGEIFRVFYLKNLEISVPQIPTYFSPTGNGILSEGTIARGRCDILNPDHLQVISRLLDHISVKDNSGPVEKLTDSEDFNV
jgi:hypothetical protein